MSEREGWLECQQALETEFHLASLNIGWKRRGTHPSAAGSFVSRCGQQHRWHWRRKLPPGSGGAYATKRPIHRTSNKRTLPRDRYKGSIVYRIVRSINHRPKKSGDFLTYALSAPLRRRDAERITFLDRNDHYARSRKKDQILSTIRDVRNWNRTNSDFLLSILSRINTRCINISIEEMYTGEYVRHTGCARENSIFPRIPSLPFSSPLSSFSRLSILFCPLPSLPRRTACI